MGLDGSHPGACPSLALVAERSQNWDPEIIAKDKQEGREGRAQERGGVGHQSAQPGSAPGMDKQVCSGKQACNGKSKQDKASCQGHDQQGQPAGAKLACSGP